MKEIEIPFGAKDSELKGFEYTIPEGMEAIIKNGKVIVRKKESKDERIRKEIIDWMKGGNTYEWQDNKDRWIAYLEKQKEQKPAEWSGEDEGMLNCIIATLCEESHGGREANDKMVTWLENRLKSLRTQPHWKPSENKDVYEIAYERYPINNRLVREVTKDINEDTRDGFIDGYNYCNSTHWKPSKKQMEALEDAFRKDGGNEYRKVINSLYCDLQKLL